MLNFTVEFITFLLITGSVMYCYYYLEEKYKRSVIMKRLFGSRAAAGAYEKKRMNADFKEILTSFGLVAMPKREEEVAGIRKLLGYAGYRFHSAVVIFFGLKLLLALVCGGLYLFVAILSGKLELRGLLFVFFPVAAGYYLPVFFLKHKVVARHRKIFRELPDVLDLLLICMEAGLSFDMALYRVSKELSSIAPVLSYELGRYFLEIKGGLPRKQVLTNLADRNGEKNLVSVVHVLIQSANFGTDIAETIKVYSDSLRTERKQLAEERGAKISTKLTFPTILLILPALMLIVLGPAIINLMERLK